MTGAEATYGQSAHQGMALAIQQVNEEGGIQGRRIRLVTLDSMGRPDESARAITKLINQPEVMAILTGVVSSNALAMTPIAQQYQIPFIATISTHPKVTSQGDYIFRVCLMDSFQGEVMARFAIDNLKLKKAVILQDHKSDYSIGLAEKFSSTFSSKGGEVLMTQTYSAGDVDFKSQLTAVRAKKPDMIYIPGYYTDVSLIARQARELGMEIPLLGGDGWDSPKLKEIGGDALSGSYFSASYSPEAGISQLKKFQSDYKRVFNSIPDGLAVTGYEGAQVLVNALKRVKTLSRLEIRNALSSSQVFQTLTGSLSFDSSRNAIRSAVVLQIEKGGGLKYQATLSP
jgi:branched-chain amino acid transport system substrate-binding protein